MIRLARSAHGEEGLREGDSRRNRPGGPRREVRVVPAHDHVEHALLDVRQVGRPPPGRPRHVLRSRPVRLLRSDHVLVQVGEDLLLLAGMIREVAVLRIDLVAPPEADAAAGPGKLALRDELRQRASDLQHAGDPRLVVVGRDVLLKVARQDDLGQRGVGARDSGLDHRRLLLRQRRRFDDDPRPKRLGVRRARRLPIAASSPRPTGPRAPCPAAPRSGTRRSSSRRWGRPLRARPTRRSDRGARRARSSRELFQDRIPAAPRFQTA